MDNYHVENIKSENSGKFYSMLFRMNNINRWGLMYNTRSETLAEHSFECAILAQALAIIGNVYFEKSYNVDRIVSMALLHDMSEILTGDLPTPIKYYNEEIKNAYKQIEADATETMLKQLDDKLRLCYAPLTTPNKEEKKILKSADKLCAYIKCEVEISRGNPEFKTASQTINSAIEAMDCIELKYFMVNCFPSFLTSLDDNLITTRPTCEKLDENEINS